MQAIKVVDDPEKFKLLADNTRRKIVFLLRATEMNASQIREVLQVTPQTVYHHIKKLQEADLIKVTREERAGHLIESYYRATAEAFICSVGSTSQGKEFLEKQMTAILDNLSRIGLEVEYSEEDVAVLLRLQDDLMRESSSENFMENIEDKLSDIDAGTVSFIKEYARLILMSEEDFQKYLDHKAEFRSKLKSLLKE